jgi:hypothetical protein
MPKPRRRKSKQQEMIRRNAVISSFTPSMRLSVRSAKEAEPEIEGRPWLELRGTLVEPIRDVRDVVFKLWPDPETRVGPARPAPRLVTSWAFVQRSMWRRVAHRPTSTTSGRSRFLGSHARLHVFHQASTTATFFS